MDDAGLEALRDAIRHMHGCASTWVEEVAVREMLGAAVVWDGAVQVFDLGGHATAERAYAWSFATEGAKRRFVAVLHARPVDSAAAAVRAFIVAESNRA